MRNSNLFTLTSERIHKTRTTQLENTTKNARVRQSLNLSSLKLDFSNTNTPTFSFSRLILLTFCPLMKQRSFKFFINYAIHTYHCYQHSVISLPTQTPFQAACSTDQDKKTKQSHYQALYLLNKTLTLDLIDTRAVYNIYYLLTNVSVLKCE